MLNLFSLLNNNNFYYNLSKEFFLYFQSYDDQYCIQEMLFFMVVKLKCTLMHKLNL